MIPGMKVRDSGMPEQTYWETLFDVPGILDRLRVDRTMDSVVEVGCGYGTFTVPVAQRITGTLHTFDIEPGMIATTSERLRMAGIHNAKLVQRDVLADGFDLAPASVDAVLLFNILHLENPTDLLRASAELLRPSGRVLVIHWRSDIPTPRGPDLSIRPRPEQILVWANETGFLDPKATPVTLLPWHFGVGLRRR
jgi:SAM-dependent methyltransferase